MTDQPYRKKLIEVALPLDAVNKASVREKSIRHGHPSTLHLWWARRPLAAARAVIFAQMVDDPSEYVDVLLSDPQKKRAAQRELKRRLAVHAEKQALAGTDELPEPEPTLDGVIAETERERLFSILEELVVWENTNDEAVLQKARDEIWQSWRRTCAENAGHPRAGELFDRNALPAFHDPFAGGGALPLEAQRLGLEAHASDLNPVAVLINKAMIEIPPKFAGRPPVNPRIRSDEALFSREWRGAAGLAEDVRYYGEWMRDEAEKRIGHLYPKVRVTAEMVAERPDLKPYAGRDLTVIAWLWARTVKSPNPAFADVDVPLASTFMISAKAGKEAYVEPVIEDCDYRFAVKTGKPADAEAAKWGTSGGRQRGFYCLMSGVPVSYDYVRQEGKAGRMGAKLMAVVAEGDRGRVYLAPTTEHAAVAAMVEPAWRPENELVGKCRDQMPLYGMDTFGDLFTLRQLVALATFSDLIVEAKRKVHKDAINEFLDEDTSLQNKGTEALAYAESVATYLGLVSSKCSDYWSNMCTWQVQGSSVRGVFSRQAIAMVWDFAEANPFSNSTGNWMARVNWACKAIEKMPANIQCKAMQSDAQKQSMTENKIVSTDPPYYDNIGYADLSDFFYVWLRHTLRYVYADIFSTMAVPKNEELIAASHRHNDKKEAEDFFLKGMTNTMHRLAKQAHPAFPVSIYYAFKQSETKGKEGSISTGWETFLDALIRSGFSITGTWPMRTELANRISMKKNILTSSIVIVCRKRPVDAPISTRREFVDALKDALPVALTNLQHGNIAPVDLTQAAIGPGMGVFTRYAKVVEADGSVMTVRLALQLINRTLDEFLSAQEAEMDDWTRFAVTWFSEYGFDAGPFGEAETIATARNISVEGVQEAGIAQVVGGKVMMIPVKNLPDNWEPSKDKRLTVWEVVHQLILRIENPENKEEWGEAGAAILLQDVGKFKEEEAKVLCYRLYKICEERKWASQALLYNMLIASWSEITKLSARLQQPKQTEMPETKGF